jgi:hypothetical protein
MYCHLDLNLAKIGSDVTLSLPSLPLVRLRVLKREPTRPLIRTSLAADPPVAARKQNAPHGNRSEEPRTEAAHAERCNTRFGPHAVAVEGIGRVEERRDGQRGQRIRRFGVRLIGRDTCTWLAVERSSECDDVPSRKLLDSGTEPVRSIVSAPSVSSVKPSMREK